MNRAHGGLVLRTVRTIKGFTQEQVSAMMDIPLRTYQRWETCKSEPEFGTVFAICESVFKVELSEVIALAREYESERKRAG